MLPIKSMVAAFACVTSMIGCNILPSADKESLTKTGAVTASSTPDCASCHAYPLKDVHHRYHLGTLNVNRDNLNRTDLNGEMTCLDCHFNSIQHFSYVHSDTSWLDSAGNEIESHTSPSDQVGGIEGHRVFRPLPQFPVDTLQGENLGTGIDTLIMQFASKGEVTPWKTGWTHYNGKVDVSFPPNDITQSKSPDSIYRPKDLSCSSIACHHKKEATYRFLSVSQGLSACPSVSGRDSTCGEKNP